MKKDNSRNSKKPGVKSCPKCRSSNITLYMGGALGIQYQCKKCGYVGPLILEKSR